MGSGTTMHVNPQVAVIEGGHRRPSYLLGVPTMGMVSARFWQASLRLASPMNCISSLMLVERMEVGVARNEIAKYYMNMNPRPAYLFFYGDDMLPPWDGLLKLYDEIEDNHWDVLTGLYYLKTEPPTPVMWRGTREGPMLPGRDFTVGEVVSVDVCGLDFTLIRAEAFEAIEYPYFETNVEFTPVDANGNGMMHKSTEDGYFMAKLREKKLRIGVHTGVRVGHLHVGSGMVY